MSPDRRSDERSTAASREETGPGMDPRIAVLLDKQEIREVVYRYCRGIDRRDLARVRDCYHPDASDRHGSFSGTVDEYLTWVDALLARYVWTMHLIANVIVELEEPLDHAAVESYGVALHRSDEPRPHLNLATGFRYLDHFERRAGSWRIASRVAVSEWSIRIPGDAWWPIPDSLPKGRRDANDPLHDLLSSVAEAVERDGPTRARPRTDPSRESSE